MVKYLDVLKRKLKINKYFELFLKLYLLTLSLNVFLFPIGSYEIKIPLLAVTLISITGIILNRKVEKIIYTLFYTFYMDFNNNFIQHNLVFIYFQLFNFY